MHAPINLYLIPRPSHVIGTCWLKWKIDFNNSENDCVPRYADVGAYEKQCYAYITRPASYLRLTWDTNRTLNNGDMFGQCVIFRMLNS